HAVEGPAVRRIEVGAAWWQAGLREPARRAGDNSGRHQPDSAQHHRYPRPWSASRVAPGSGLHAGAPCSLELGTGNLGLDMTASGPLCGVRVLDCSQIVAGPFAGANLCDFGADVIKVEPPGGDPFRNLGAATPSGSKQFQSLNRGKRSIVLNL